jgi:hypothetical protein
MGLRFAEAHPCSHADSLHHRNSMRTIAPIIVVLLLGGSGAALGGEQRCQGDRARNEADFAFLANDSQVLDKRTGLIWMRCIEGQTWTGATCVAEDPNAVNPGPRLTYEQARWLAASRSTDREKWRVPTQKELLSLREPNCYSPSMSLRLFPTQPAWSSDGSFWTSTREAKGVAVVSAIGTSDSWSTIEPTKVHHVRLVRSAPKEAP